VACETVYSGAKHGLTASRIAPLVVCSLCARSMSADSEGTHCPLSTAQT